MPSLMKFLHVLAAMTWLGGIGFMLLALRPAAAALLAPAQRLPLMSQVLERFFVLVWISIAVLLPTGLSLMLGSVGMKLAPTGWHVMLGLGLLMCAIFGYLYFGPFRRLKQAVNSGNWPEGGRRTEQISTLAKINLGLGVLAIAAVLFII